jgi:hypothetical protein
MVACSHGLIKAVCWHLPGGTDENHKKSQIRITDDPAKIRNRDLLNTIHNIITTPMGSVRLVN